jgi:hypothetical protein
MKSLFVVSLPRSLSTTLYHSASRSLRLHEPQWTSGGEILNRERFTSRRAKNGLTEARFTMRDSDPGLFEAVGTLLDESVERRGFAYKDVVQPFVVAEWLDPAEFCVLKVKRDVAEVAYAMLKRHWHYPGFAASLHSASPRSLIEGLLRAERALASLPGETLHYCDAVASHEPLQSALQALYPDVALSPVAYINRAFVRTRSRVEHRRQLAAFAALCEVVDDVRSTLANGEPSLTLERAARNGHLDPISAAAST